MMILLWIALLTLLFRSNSDVICPASSIMDLNNSNSYFYPVDIYAPPGIKASIRSTDMFPCYSQYRTLYRTKFHCSNKRFCPVHRQNVVDATIRKSHKSSSLCYLKNVLSTKSETVRIFVSGGSVTSGVNSRGCISTDPIGKKPADAPHEYKRCAWPYYFGEWLKQTSKATVLMYNIANNRYTSNVQSEALSDIMRLNNIESFTANDVIFLDHGVNDDHNIRYLEKEVENFILKIYALSSVASWPSIILLDSAAAYRNAFNPKRYLKYYEVIAAHYNLQMWSYREAVHSNYSTTVQSQYISYINHDNNWIMEDGKVESHPPWHVHLFMADLYAAIWETKMLNCTEHLQQTTTRLHSSAIVLPSVKTERFVGQCGLKEIFLRGSYDDVMQNTTIGSYNFKPSNSWYLVESEDGRKGFVSDNSFKVNEASVNVNPEITFYLLNTTEQLKNRNIEDIYVHLSYLRTYDNAGVVDIYICNRKYTQLDTLWVNAKSTIPSTEMMSFVLHVSECVDVARPFIKLVRIHANNSLEVRKDEQVKIISIKACLSI